MDRSEIMRRVKSRDTSPELRVRAALRRLGWTGYRLQRKDLPGKPDIAFIGRRRAIFVHGCFWHGHDCARGDRPPRANAEYWRAKIQRNRDRDARNDATLTRGGWRVLTIWECQTKSADELDALLLKWLEESA